jgi:electron transfer flavoprotein alpha subunit
MACVLVVSEVREGAPTGPSLFAVGEARRLADVAGVTVYALFGIGDEAGEQALDSIAADLGRAGADRALGCLDPALRGAPLDDTFGPLLAAVAEKLNPRLVLLPAGSFATQLAPPLAARLGATFFPRAKLVAEPGAAGPPRVELLRFRPRGDGQRLVSLTDVDRRLVATLGSGPPPRPAAAPVEVEVLAYPGAAAGPLAELWSEPDDGTAVELAETIVLVSPTLPARARQALEAAAPPGTAVLLDGDRPVPGLDAACPARLLVLSGRAGGLLTRVRPAPAATITWIGAKGPPKGTPFVNGICRQGAERGAADLAAALGARAARPDDAAKEPAP